ncbi:MAG: YtxH domain-containing protein [Mahellales bacterium]
MASKYLRGFMTGAIVGIAAGMYFLPRLNSNIRNNIDRPGSKFLNNMSTMAEDFTKNI